MHAYLRTLKWKPVTQHFKSHYMPVSVDDTLLLYMSGGEYALVNTVTNEYAKVPLFIANEWRCSYYNITRGPFIFKNGFNETDEAAYLLQMLQYQQLTARAQAKVKDIRRRFADWINYDEEIKGYLKGVIRWL